MKSSTAYMPPSETVEWSTPQDLFNALNEEFGFTIDVAATDENAKLPRYFTEEIDGLAQSWDNEIVWCNPPYGRVIKDWAKKASEQKDGVVVMLIPSRTDTAWFHDYIYGKAEIRFIRGRLKFGGHKNAAPFPNMIVIWR
jgi:site-specific DNA-methyltransferase (adenine-specific)